MLASALLGLPLPLPVVGGAPASSEPPSQGSSSSQPPLSLPKLPLSLPGVSLPTAEVGVSLPGVAVEVPSVSVPLPGVSVSTPAVGVSVPGVGASAQVSAGGESAAPSSGASPPGSGAGSGNGNGTGAGGGSPTSPSAPGQTQASGAGGGGHVAYASAAGGGARANDPPSGSSAGKAPGVAALSSGAIGGAGARVQRPVRPRIGGRRAGSGARTAPRAAAGARATALAPSDRTAIASPAPATAPARLPDDGNPLDAIGRQLPVPLPVPDWCKPIVLVLLALALWFGVRSRAQARRARGLERQRKALVRDVGAMQAALVPQVPPRVGGLVVSVAYGPADGPAAGGDFYDVFVPERGKVAVILGDAAGHGDGALTQAALVRYTLRAYMKGGMQPRVALAVADSVLSDPGAEQLATVLVGVYDSHTGCLTYASAGHPPPILHGLRTREPLKACPSPPLGAAAPTGRRQTTVSLPPGAVVCFFSDGLTDARREHDVLGRERVSDMLGELGGRPSAAKLLKRVRAKAQLTPDDMTACVFAPAVALVRAGVHVEELEVDMAAIDSGQARLFLEICQLPRLELEQALYRAGDMVASLGAALLQVELRSAAGSAAVLPPLPPSLFVGDRRPLPAGGPTSG